AADIDADMRALTRIHARSPSNRTVPGAPSDTGRGHLSACAASSYAAFRLSSERFYKVCCRWRTRAPERRAGDGGQTQDPSVSQWPAVPTGVAVWGLP